MPEEKPTPVIEEPVRENSVRSSQAGTSKFSVHFDEDEFKGDAPLWEPEPQSTRVKWVSDLGNSKGIQVGDIFVSEHLEVDHSLTLTFEHTIDIPQAAAAKSPKEVPTTRSWWPSSWLPPCRGPECLRAVDPPELEFVVEGPNP